MSKRILVGLAAALVAALGLSSPAQAAVPSATTIFTARSGNQQGLATDGHYTWVTQDAGHGQTRIVTYTWNGRYVGTSALLPLGHGAEADYRVKDHRLYVVNGGMDSESTGADTKVYGVTLDAHHVASGVVQTYDFTWLGRNGLVAVNNKDDTLITMGGHDAGPWTLTVHNFNHAARNTALSNVTITDPGVLLQGLAVVGGNYWVYVSAGTTSRIDKFDACGHIISRTVLPFTGEAEGITVNPITGSVYAGAHSANRVMRIGGV